MRYTFATDNRLSHDVARAVPQGATKHSRKQARGELIRGRTTNSTHLDEELDGIWQGVVLWQMTPAVQRLPRRVETDMCREAKLVFSRPGAPAEAERVELLEQPSPLAFLGPNDTRRKPTRLERNGVGLRGMGREGEEKGAAGRGGAGSLRVCGVGAFVLEPQKFGAGEHGACAS